MTAEGPFNQLLSLRVLRVAFLLFARNFLLVVSLVVVVYPFYSGLQKDAASSAGYAHAFSPPSTSIQHVPKIVLCARLLLIDEIEDASYRNKKNVQVSSEILTGLCTKQNPTSQTTESETKLLDIETDFFDPTTGLHSEVVWHNCLLGIARLQLIDAIGRQQPEDSSSGSTSNGNNTSKTLSLVGQSLAKSAIHISQSLFQHSWDGTSFRRRSWSGNWDHDKLFQKDSEGNPVLYQANYYLESPEHRCVQHGMALAFWSLLNRKLSPKSHSFRTDDKDLDKEMKVLRHQQHLIATQFIDEFWNDSHKKWTTISVSQGGGSILRPSASSNKVTVGTTEEDASVPYFRAVDQAIAILACLEYLQMPPILDGDNPKEYKVDYIEDIIRATCKQLLSTSASSSIAGHGVGGFGYENLSSATTYIGLKRNRNFWHDGWVLLALIQAYDYLHRLEYDLEGYDTNAVVVGDKLSFELLQSLYTDMTQRYGHQSGDGTGDEAFDGTVWHWSPAERDDASNVRYCGDNVLFYAIRHRLEAKWRRLSRNDNGKTHELDSYGCGDDGFWDLLAILRSKSEIGLSSVADVYPQVRLHPNSELAALLVWP